MLQRSKPNKEEEEEEEKKKYPENEIKTGRI